MRTVRVFVSSPDDAAHERRRVERVVERLNGAFASSVRLVTVRWEVGFYAAHATFQAQIPEAAACDVVVAIFRNRLGTVLPPNFPRMPDGEPYPSGTAYEVLTAIEARKSGDLPDVFVFRNPLPPSVTLDDPVGEAQVRDQWERLKRFFERWFVTADGQFKAAFQNYDDVDRFEREVERLLRQWLEEHVLGARTLAWPIAAKGSPFRGLAAFGARHAEVFFGRDRDIERTVDALKDAASGGERLAFLLLIGPSGSGKSSLARAGLLPRLIAAGVVPEVDQWRTAVMRPAEVAGDPFLSLATRLFDAAADLTEDEAGRPPALPELRDGDHATPQALAGLLRHADDSALSPILKALDRIAAQEKAEARTGRASEARLLLVVDQLDELLGAVEPDSRQGFARLLGLMAGSGRVWIIATLRADLYEPFSREVDLQALKARGAVYDVAPPGAAALEEIVRRPAEAAGLGYDERILPNGRRQRLDERLIADGGRPDMLPLVQFTLNRLFERRIVKAGRTILGHAAYEALGGLDGAIAQEAEAALAPLGEAEQGRLPRLLRQLVSSAQAADAPGAARPTIRAVPYGQAAHDGPAKTLVDGLIAARILLVEGGGSEASAGQVRLAHQRVLEAWPRARDIVAANARFFRIKPEVERAERRWLDSGKPASLLLARGVALFEAETIAREFGKEIAPGTLGYIEASSRRARRSLHLAIAAAALFAVVASGAAGAGYRAYLAEQRAEAERFAAERNFELAKETIDTVIFEFVEGFQHTDGVHGSVLRKVLVAVMKSLDSLAEAAPRDDELRRSRGVVLSQFGELFDRVGDHESALAVQNESLALARSLVQRKPEDIQRQHDVGVQLMKIGDLLESASDLDGALDSVKQALTIHRELALRDPEKPSGLMDLAIGLLKLGDLYESKRQSDDALNAYEEGLKHLKSGLEKGLSKGDRDSTEFIRMAAIANAKIGDLLASKRPPAGALAAYDASLAMFRWLVQRDNTNTLWRQELAALLDSIGDLQASVGNPKDGSKAYQESLEIRRNLAQRNADRADFQFYLAATLYRTALVTENDAARRGFLVEALDILQSLDADKKRSNREKDADLIRHVERELAKPPPP